ncbi:2-C-methyl-D-erythritol 4-phosphate cytidylyltransferase [candidate division WOR-3 bacterium]|uniref:2-C-methyl-D-erythritol 4-phosphate cytidylyltransferase n=1 Tax=candidate division WOR-3 bacterium TaxID=2052148 RepID=A0A9D5K9C7_UNCW3|nr:2-C-methyl-D-erythritol 4-phosphate cytidylyltransferase [candidate division WOR-3 bacterium]MBD3364520.1 2-C-methyl-D-erythritol 4-phosphate cytidylyltransferase [candidate division WOR-3 bacterium]
MVRFGLILAAGRGERFGAPKQQAILGGHPLALWSILAFEQCPEIDLIVLVVDEPGVEFFEHQIKMREIEKVEAIVPGGAERVDSLKAGLKVLPHEGRVAVHDGARPFVRSEDITEGFYTLDKEGSAIYALEVTDTLKRIEKGMLIETVSRDGLYRAQTPQFYPLPILKEALRRAEEEGFVGTDEASYVERMGFGIHILTGREENIKITFPQDLELAEKLLTAGT